LLASSRQEVAAVTQELLDKVNMRLDGWRGEDIPSTRQPFLTQHNQLVAVLTKVIKSEKYVRLLIKDLQWGGVELAG
jgi:hypothetical protein